MNTEDTPKQLTIDEILLKNGITYLTPKYHDNIIAAFNEYGIQEKQKLKQQLEAQGKGALVIIQGKIDEITKLQNDLRELTINYKYKTNTLNKIKELITKN